MTASPSAATAMRKSSVPIVAPGMAGRTDLLLWLLIVYLILEYMRPPLIVQLRLQMIISLVLPVLCYMQIKDRKWSPILTCQIGVFVVSAIGIVYAYNYYAAYMTTRTLYTTVVVSISMAWLLARMELFRRVVWVWTLIMTYLGVWGIVMGGTGPGGFIGDENDLALACNTAIPTAYFGAVYGSGWRRFLYVGIGVILLSAVVASASRGGFVGLAAMTLYVILISKHRIRSLAIVALAAGIFYVSVPQSYLEEITSIEKEASGELEGGTGEARLFLWEAAFNMWKAHPILGVGAGNSQFHTGRYQPDWEGSNYSERDWSGTAIHSALFQSLSELGSVGIFFYGGLLYHHFRGLRRLRKLVRFARRLPESLSREVELHAGALAGGVIGFMASGFFLSVAYYPYAFYFSALSVALDWSVERELALRSAPPNTRPPAERPSGSGTRSDVTERRTDASLGRALTNPSAGR